MSLRPEVRSNRRQLLAYTLAYSMGRVSSYMVAGLLAGGVGQTLLEWIFPNAGLGWLRLVAGLMVIAMGLHFAGWLPRFASLERLGGLLWRHLDPLARRLLTVGSLPQAVLLGAPAAKGGNERGQTGLRYGRDRADPRRERYGAAPLTRPVSPARYKAWRWLSRSCLHWDCCSQARGVGS